MVVATGPSIRAVCRILNRNSCGSGSICGIQPSGQALILTNAHVAGTTIGRIVDVEVESTGDRIKARVIKAAYSDRTVSDWALLETVDPYTKVKPVYLSKKRPSGSHYTKGFPRCKPHGGTDITTQDFGSNGVWFWEPDAIGGQSGSGVWSDDDQFQYGLLTWQWGSHGAGQQTAEIYRQAVEGSTRGYERPEGLVELDNEYDLDDQERGEDNPTVENGFFGQMSISDMPIWAEDIVVPDPDPDPDNPAPADPTRKLMVEFMREQAEFYTGWQRRLELGEPKNPAPGPSGTYGLLMLIMFLLLPTAVVANDYGLGDVDPNVEASSSVYGLESESSDEAITQFGLGIFAVQQDCPGGVCPLPQRQITSPKMSFTPTLARPQRVTRNYGMSSVLQQQFRRPVRSRFSGGGSNGGSIGTVRSYGSVGGPVNYGSAGAPVFYSYAQPVNQPLIQQVQCQQSACQCPQSVCQQSAPTQFGYCQPVPQFAFQQNDWARRSEIDHLAGPPHFKNRATLNQMSLNQLQALHSREHSGLRGIQTRFVLPRLFRWRQ